MKLKRPIPPVHLRDDGWQFESAPSVTDWMRETFIDGPSQLINEDHQHLTQAEIGVIWTNWPAKVHGIPIVGTAEFVQMIGRGRPWGKQRQQAMLDQLEVSDCDFIITLFAPYCHTADDATFCSIIEHELYHCGQQERFGFPWFRKSGGPMFGIKGHDVEEFVGVVRRYGAGAAAGETAALVRAANRAPEVAAADIASMCGTCRKGAAA